jgi:hypothetical protein
MRIRAAVLALTAVLVLGLAACSSSSKSGSSGSNRTQTTTKGFQVETPDGQVSLSLNGQLPPNWPSSFPIPDGATVAGSGSLANDQSGALVGVYTTSESPTDTYNFYKSNSSLTVTSSKSAGGNNAFLGSVKLGGGYPGGSVTVAALSGSTYIVIILKPAASTTTTLA